VVLSGLGIYKLIQTLPEKNVAQNTVIESNASVNIYDEEKKPNNNIQIYEEENNNEKKELTVAFLGELMMGGNIGKSLNYNYMAAFKNIAEYTSKADYTSVNLVTNVIDLKKLENPKSKYIVTKSIENAFSALGVDGINLASDHMLDFGKEIFNDTVSILKEDYDLIGLKDTIVYVEKDGIKIAIIGVCNEVIGTEGAYTEAGIMMYNMKKIKAMIKEAKKNVNTVVVLTHLGLENTHTVTSIMSWFYKELIDGGADAVLGSHALGLYPVEIYKGKPIVYSMSNLMSDTDYLLGKESGIFTLSVNEKGRITALNIMPLYINAKKQTILYKDYNNDTNAKLLEYLVEDLDDSQYKIQNNMVTIDIK